MLSINWFLIFCHIDSQHKLRANVDREIIIDENANDSVCFLVGDLKSLWSS